MLSDLDRVPWASLTHAYGSAEDVPDILRGLTSKDADERADAIDALYGNIWHQGTVYEATGHAVPFLLEIATEPSVEDRAEILQLLYMIAHGSSYLDVHQHLSHVGQMLRDEPNFDEQLALELQWVRRANDAVVAGHSRYLELLDDRDEAVRRLAAKLLSVCRPAASDLCAPMIAKAETADPALRGSLLFALAVLDPERARPLLMDALGSDAAIVRLTAAMALCFHGKEPPPTRALDVLAHHLVNLDEVDYDLFPFGEDQGADIAMALTRAAPADKRRYAEILLESAETGKAKIFSVVQPLLALAFERPLEEPTLESLDPVQRRVLEFVAHKAFSKLNGNWSIFVNFVDHLRAYGLEKLGEAITGYSN